ncbi:hypothetical protein [Caulobacter sp. DWR2-3-1b2]|uniref:hypothetical protein n=1 Tax=unclassified Caulobacter TaxID=2648921 RepID=UPI0019935BDF|nr:hypothetical protein [Caulobacter sp.]
MAAYDASYGKPAASSGLFSSLSDKLSGLFGSKAAPAFSTDPNAPAPPVDYALTPDAQGKITLAGYKVPVALAVVGAVAVGALLINRRTRAPAIAAAATAWSFLGKKAV